MCGRFIIGNQAAIEHEFAIAQPLWSFSASYNVAPTNPVPVVRMREGQRNTGAHPFRMPALLSKQDREQWLAGSDAEARAALKPYPQECMVAYQVSTRVNTPRNNDPTLIEPVDTKIADDQGDKGQLPLIQ